MSDHLQVRRRVYIACLNCRKRKIKCMTEESDRKPCDRCIRHGLVCEYVPVADESIHSALPGAAPQSDVQPFTAFNPYPVHESHAHTGGTWPQYTPVAPAFSGGSSRSGESHPGSTTHHRKQRTRPSAQQPDVQPLTAFDPYAAKPSGSSTVERIHPSINPYPATPHGYISGSGPGRSHPSAHSMPGPLGGQGYGMPGYSLPNDFEYHPNNWAPSMQPPGQPRYALEATYETGAIGHKSRLKFAFVQSVPSRAYTEGNRGTLTIKQ
ncbi:hypothetical protein B0H17DRAFT_1139006 [Mycena rosella]|uniref:Zn(2)-C6 fungal-type domain-containing protein n=1 Tax=Mycena rosella TaxID=1033263 RepID=A0AAD7GBL3_MYCRO|nr:hypothetical protein B0H17DRAFT_1139006 [Mycena rosella]